MDSKQLDEDMISPHHTLDSSPRMSLWGDCGLEDTLSSDRLVKNWFLFSEQDLVIRVHTGYSQCFEVATKETEYNTPNM